MVNQWAGSHEVGSGVLRLGLVTGEWYLKDHP